MRRGDVWGANLDRGGMIYMVVFASERRMERATSGVGFACVDGCLSESAMIVNESRSGRFEAESLKHDIGTDGPSVSRLFLPTRQSEALAWHWKT
jgi:hypothetical protein